MKLEFENNSAYNWTFAILKYAIMIAAYSYLIWVLVNFDNYQAFAEAFTSMSGQRVKWFLSCVALMPLNWFVEGVKWKQLVDTVYPIALRKACASVLAGLTAGFFTPNRIGDPAGRIIMVAPGKRTECAALSLVGIMAQNFATFMFGIAAGIIFVSSRGMSFTEDDVNVQIYAGVTAFLFAIVYFALPYICGKIKNLFDEGRVKRLLSAVGGIKISLLLKVGILSMLRFVIYCTQYFLMLRFFAVHIEAAQAIVLLPLNYLLITITPSVAFSEIGIRGAYAALIMGTVSDNTAGAALAGIAVWLLNYVLPMFVGSLLMLKNNDLQNKSIKNEENKDTLGG